MDPVEAGLPPHGRPPGRWGNRSGTLWTGAVLIIVGVYFLLNHLGFIPRIDWEVIWPVLLILLGAYFVVRRLR